MSGQRKHGVRSTIHIKAKKFAEKMEEIFDRFFKLEDRLEQLERRCDRRFAGQE